MTHIYYINLKSTRCILRYDSIGGYMKQDEISLKEIVEVDSEYRNKLEDLKNDINNREVPSWILIPKRSSGEHATGNAWLGIVISACSEGGEYSTIDTRIAINTEDRTKNYSTVGEVPPSIKDPLLEATNKIDNEIKMYIARLKYKNSSRQLEDIEIILRLEDENEDENA